MKRPPSPTIASSSSPAHKRRGDGSDVPSVVDPTELTHQVAQSILDLAASRNLIPPGINAEGALANVESSAKTWITDASTSMLKILTDAANSRDSSQQIDFLKQMENLRPNHPPPGGPAEQDGNFLQLGQRVKSSDLADFRVRATGKKSLTAILSDLVTGVGQDVIDYWIFVLFKLLSGDMADDDEMYHSFRAVCLQPASAKPKAVATQESNAYNKGDFREVVLYPEEGRAIVKKIEDRQVKLLESEGSLSEQIDGSDRRVKVCLRLSKVLYLMKVTGDKLVEHDNLAKLFVPDELWILRTWAHKLPATLLEGLKIGMFKNSDNQVAYYQYS